MRNDQWRRPIRARARARVAGLIGRRLGPPPVGVILLYHRVVTTEFDPFGICVSPARFAEQLRSLARECRVGTLEELVGALDEKSSQARRPLVVVSFDDGYADTLHAAQPIAAEVGIPLTVFAAVEPILRGQRFWWDELTAGIEGARANGRGLAATVRGREHRFTLATEAEAKEACTALQRLLFRLPAAERAAALDQLLAGGDPVTALDGARPMTGAELQLLASRPGVTIGGHTVSHPVLASLSPQEQAAEVTEGKRSLERLVGRPVEFFAYPFGGRRDVERRTRAIVAATGFRAACTTIQGAVSRRTSRFSLPRLTVHEWSGAELLARILELRPG
jgi:peptidoglycan/xylan/chitin deacetylase (PgdA/CDA1 family)